MLDVGRDLRHNGMGDLVAAGTAFDEAGEKIIGMLAGGGAGGAVGGGAG